MLSRLTKGGFVNPTVVELVLFPAVLDSEEQGLLLSPPWHQGH